MTENIGLRIRFGDTWVIVTPTETSLFNIEISRNELRVPVQDDARELEALEHLQHNLVDVLRKQIWDLIQEKKRKLGLIP